jgi:hypothetical protein
MAAQFLRPAIKLYSDAGTGKPEKDTEQMSRNPLSGVEARFSLEETARPPLVRLNRRTARVGFS